MRCLHTAHCLAERGEARAQAASLNVGWSPRGEPALGEEDCKGQSGTLMAGEVAGTVCDAWLTARRGGVKVVGVLGQTEVEAWVCVRR